MPWPHFSAKWAIGNPALRIFSPKSLQTFSQIWHLTNVRRIGILFVACFCLAALAARAAHTQVELWLSADTARPGRSSRIAMAPVFMHPAISATILSIDVGLPLRSGRVMRAG